MVFPYYCMGDLASYSSPDGVAKPLDEKLARNVFVQLCSAVRSVHKLGIVHRDIKCENILVDLVDGHLQVILADFGFAIEEAKMMMKFEKVGTPKYMAYEIVKGATMIDHRVDIWSLGVLLYKLLYADFPFKPMEKDALYMSISARSFTFPH